MYIHIPEALYSVVTFGSEVFIIGLLVRAVAKHVSMRAATIAAVVLIGWCAVAISLGASGVYRYGPPGLIGAGVGGPLVLAALAFAFIKPLRDAVARVPLADLVGVQAFRLLGFMFLLRLITGVLPALFALPAGIGDMLTGAGAIALAFALRTNAPGAQRSAAFWNAFGILDLVVAVFIGFTSSATPLQLFHVTPAPDALGVLPTIMIPTFAVPLFLILHGITLSRLRSGAPASLDYARDDKVVTA